MPRRPGIPEVWIRWGYQVTLEAWPMSGWNIDDIEVWGEARVRSIDAE